MQAAEIRNALAQLDVGATTGHVRGDCYRTALPGARNNLGFLLMILGVQNRMHDPNLLQHPREMFARLDRDRAHQDWPSLLMDTRDLFEDCAELFALRLIDRIVRIVSRHRLVRWDDKHA